MKEILHIARLDFLTVKPMTLPAWIAVFLLALVMGAFFSPAMFAFLIVSSPLLIIPAESVAVRCGYNKLYGILPVRRRNITRGRFLLLWLSMTLPELLALLLAKASLMLQLWRLFPVISNDFKGLIESTFDPANTQVFMMLTAIYTFISLLFCYMQMMGQIFGLENEIRIVMISLAVLTVVLLGFFILSDHGILPMLRIPDLSALTPVQTLWFCIGCHLAAAVLHIVCAEITAAKMSRREL